MSVLFRHDQELAIPLRYPVVFTRGLFGEDNGVLADVLTGSGRERLLVVVDAGLSACWPALAGMVRDWAARQADLVELVGIEAVVGGEAAKNDMAIVDRLGRSIRDHGMCRHSYVMVIGGGAVLDAAGFAVAIAHRGLRLLRVPTTVLSQNDSGVGVKNGINRFGLKNYYGVFTPPQAVVCDLDFLDTLPDRVWVSGVAEAFKVAIIRDAAFLEFLVEHAEALGRRDPAATERMVIRTAELHLAQIAHGGDPFERGSSRPLDFGHWVAHKLEAMTDFAVLHGEGVSIGMTVDLYYAAGIGLVSEAEVVRVCRAMMAVGLPVYHPLTEQRFDELLVGLEEFREHLGGALTLAMPGPMGSQRDLHTMDPEQIRAAVAAASRLASDPGSGRR